MKQKIMGFISIIVAILVFVQFIPDVQTEIATLTGTGGALENSTAGTILGFVTLGLAVTVLIMSFSSSDNA